ncbi:MAG TPA: sulfatase-like hydrolase/transferase, partial [Planctomycetota bacterium]|nr:sulfatase-like hydrolase/transferase [Planctomycetota bacterium]
MSPLRAALVLVLASACGGDEGMPTGPNVLLVTLDTTRADRLGCYGYAAARTPAIDALAEAGARFDAARSPVPLTLPSHASLLTGVHPAAHGLHVNFQGAVSDEARTLAEALRGCGYRTGAFVAAWVLNREFGLARGFDRY